MTTYTEDFEGGTLGAFFTEFAHLPTDSILVTSNPPYGAYFVSDVVHSGSQAVALNNAGVDWSRYEEGPWGSGLFSAWFRMGHTDEATQWNGSNQIQLVTAVDLDHVAIANVMLFNPDQATVTTQVGPSDAPITVADTYTFAVDTWYLARVSFDGAAVRAELLDESLNVLVSSSQPYALPGLASMVLSAGANGAAGFTWLDDVELTLVPTATIDGGLGTSRSFFTGTHL